MAADANEKTVLTQQEANELLAGGISQSDWYYTTTVVSETKLRIATWLGLICGLSASALAAMPRTLMNDVKSLPHLDDGVKWAVAILTLLVTLFSTTLTSRYRRRAVDREKGRLATALLLERTRTTLIHRPMTLAERGDYLERYFDSLIAIESTHGSFDGKGADEKATDDRVSDIKGPVSKDHKGEHS